MARIKSATTCNPKRKRGLNGNGYINSFEYLPQLESVHPRHYGIIFPDEFRGHWRKPKWKNSKTKERK